jgi:transcriptional regulator with XRE-family HTH domain
MSKDNGDASGVLALRRAAGETQEQFAKRLGVGLRSLKRYEREGTMPRTEAVKRTLRALAKKHDVTLSEESK